MSAKSELQKLVNSLSEHEARQALDELRELVTANGASRRDEAASVEREETQEIFHEVTVEEGKALFDRAARTIVGLSGEEFLCEWDGGRLDRNVPRIVHVAMLIPFARPD